MITRAEEEDIRRIVREEIALDELRRIERKRTASRSIPPVPGAIAPTPGTILFSIGEASE